MYKVADEQEINALVHNTVKTYMGKVIDDLRLFTVSPKQKIPVEQVEKILNSVYAEHIDSYFFEVIE